MFQYSLKAFISRFIVYAIDEELGVINSLPLIPTYD